MPLYHVEELEEFKRVIMSAQCPIIIDFYAPWCGPCKVIGPVFEKCATMDECKDLIFLKIDVDKAVEISELCSVTAMPTFQAYHNGEKIKEFTGASIDELERMVNLCLTLSF